MKAMIRQPYEGTLTLRFPALIPPGSRGGRLLRAIRSSLAAAVSRLHRRFASCLEEV